MPVVGSPSLAWQVFLFFTLALATGRSWGQRVVVVDLNNQPLESAFLRWTCRGGGQPQNVTIDEQGVSWPTPKCSEATVVASAFGYLTDTLVLVRPASEQVELRITLQPMSVDLPSAEVEEQSNEPLAFMSSFR